MSRLRSSKAFLLAVLVVVAGLTVPAGAQGTHVAVASMQSKRALHTMTRLPSGKVVAIGGEDPFLTYEALVTAEVYDPATNVWALTGNLNHGREEHAATLLADGRVLVTGGQDPTSVAWYPSTFVLNSAEIFNPATNAFSAIGNMNEYRLGHQATRLANGKVLLTGGYNNPGIIFGSYGANPPQTTATAELFDPSTLTFTPVASAMTMPRAYHTATLLADGRVLIVGGNGAAAASAEIFDPATSAFVAIAAPTAQRRVHGAILLDDGRVLIAGGTSSGGTAEYFDPATQTFSALPALASTYGFWGVIDRMSDGRIYIYYEGAAQLFNPSSNTFSPQGGAGVGRIFAAGAALSNKRVLVSGGQDFVPYTFVATAAARIFIPNEPPVANAGADQQVSPGAGCTAAVTLNGALSSDPDGDALTFEWTQGGVVVGNAASVDVSLGTGTHVFTLTISDGSVTATDEVTVVVADTMPPSFAAPLPASTTLEQAGPAGTLFAIATPGATDHCDAAPVVTISGTPAGSIFPAGNTDVTFTATDAAGNHASFTITITVRDSVAPALTVPAPITAEATGASGAAVSYAVSAADDVTVSPVVSCLPASGSTFAIGTTTVECSSTDAAGNRGAASFAVTVRDTIAPVVNVPAAMTVPATGPSGANVSFTVSASDEVTASPAVICSPASGSAFALGTTTVTCTSTDAAGNTGSGSFLVTVADTTGPDITTVSSNPGQLWPPNHKMVPVTISALAIDSASATTCRVSRVTSNQPGTDDWSITGMMTVSLRAERDGSSARIYTIEVRCTDAAGNASLGSTNVIVPHDQRR
jgi:hypothetical protein